MKAFGLQKLERKNAGKKLQNVENVERGLGSKFFRKMASYAKVQKMER